MPLQGGEATECAVTCSGHDDAMAAFVSDIATVSPATQGIFQGAVMLKASLSAELPTLSLSRTEPDRTEAPFISVVVPVRNEAAYIERTLRQLLTQQYDPSRFEVIVADGDSTDSTRAVVERLQACYPNLRLVNNPKRWSSAGRNCGIRIARGDFIVIVDGHCEIGNDQYLSNLADAFTQSGADCLGRPQPLDVRGASVLQRAIAAARSCWLGHQPESFIYSSVEGFVPPQSVGAAYRRGVFEQVGLYDETFDACEDVEFNHRVDKAGLSCYITPAVRVCYSPRASLRGLFNQLYRYGRGRIRLLRKHPSTFSIGSFIPAAFLTGVFLGPVLAWLSPWLAAAYAASIGLYAFLVLLASLTTSLWPGHFRLLPWLPLVFVTIHAGSGAGILYELFAGLFRRRLPIVPTPVAALAFGTAEEAGPVR